jgi:hypothetical protein
MPESPGAPQDGLVYEPVPDVRMFRLEEDVHETRSRMNRSHAILWCAIKADVPAARNGRPAALWD